MSILLIAHYIFWDRTTRLLFNSSTLFLIWKISNIHTSGENNITPIYSSLRFKKNQCAAKSFFVSKISVPAKPSDCYHFSLPPHPFPHTPLSLPVFLRFALAWSWCESALCMFTFEIIFCTCIYPEKKYRVIFTISLLFPLNGCIHCILLYVSFFSLFSLNAALYFWDLSHCFM